MRYMLLLVTLAMTSCTSLFGGAAELDENEVGAACIFVQGQSINPFVNADTSAAILEVNLGDESAPLTADQLAAIAQGMGCSPRT